MVWGVKSAYNSEVKKDATHITAEAGRMPHITASPNLMPSIYVIRKRFIITGSESMPQFGY